MIYRNTYDKISSQHAPPKALLAKKMQTYSFHSLTNYYLIFKKSRVTIDTEKTEEKGRNKLLQNSELELKGYLSIIIQGNF